MNLSSRSDATNLDRYRGPDQSSLRDELRWALPDAPGVETPGYRQHIATRRDGIPSVLLYPTSVRMASMFRFRLRTLLIVFFVLALPMAWVAHTTRWLEQRRIIRDAWIDWTSPVTSSPYWTVDAPWQLRWLGEFGIDRIEWSSQTAVSA